MKNIDKRNLKIYFNLCNNSDVISWGYKYENECDNQYNFYYWGADNSIVGDTKYGVENLYVPNNISQKDCKLCSCDSILYLPQLNVCSKLSIVLITQKHKELNEINGIIYPAIQIGLTTASKIQGATNCYYELSNRSKYQIYKSEIQNSMLCNQKVNFNSIGFVDMWDLFDTTMGWYNNVNIKTDVSRVENILLNYLDNENNKNNYRIITNNIKKDITISFNLCANQDVLSWGYHVENNCDNRYGYYYWGYDNNKNLYGVENLLVTQYINSYYCKPCSCDSVLFLSDINLCSKLSIVLITQKHRPNINEGGTIYPSNQLGSTFISKVPGTNCLIENSKKSNYQIWKAILCGSIHCTQKVEFQLIAELEIWDLFDLTLAWVVSGSSNKHIFTDVARVENIINKYLIQNI